MDDVINFLSQVTQYEVFIDKTQFTAIVYLVLPQSQSCEGTENKGTVI